MRKLAVKIWLTIAAFFLSATVSVADCSSNANQCTPKQLCSAATSTEGGVKVWSKSSYYFKHVSKAKQVGINCGVVEIVASCDNDPELCSVDDLCKQSVQKSGGKTVWKTSSNAAGHIAFFVEYFLLSHRCPFHEVFGHILHRRGPVKSKRIHGNVSAEAVLIGDGKVGQVRENSPSLSRVNQTTTLALVRSP